MFWKTKCNLFVFYLDTLVILQALTLFRLGFLRMAQLGGVEGRKVHAAYISKNINDNEMKFGGVVKDH